MDGMETYWKLFVNRWSDFALQQPDGSYRRVGRALTSADVRAHLAGKHSLGTYVMDEQGRCSYAVFDADSADGLQVLRRVQVQLAEQGIVSYLERARRGAHLWPFVRAPMLASQVRAWLFPYCPDGVEFYPKQAEGVGYGSLIRLPLGVHLRSGRRYPFVAWTESGPVVVARSVSETLAWLGTVQRNPVPDLPPAGPMPTPRTQEQSPSKKGGSRSCSPFTTIRAWCAQQDPYAVIGRYVDVNHVGIGRCPFGWHHANGQDTHNSFKVYRPEPTSNYCWYCYTWQRGGSVFDFLRYWHGLEARELWRRIQRNEVCL